MIRILSVLICFLFTSAAFSQNFIEENYQSYLNNEDITRVQIGERMFNIAAIMTKDAKSEDAKDAHQIVSKIKSFDLLSMENIANPNQAFAAGLAKCQHLDELIRVKDKTTNVSIRIDEENDVIREIVGLIASDSGFVVFTLVGEIDINEVGKLVNKIQDEKMMGNLLGTKKVEIEEVKVFPNPSKKNATTTIEIPENLIGGKLVVYDLSGKKITDLELSSSSLELNTSTLSNATYMLKFEKGPISINKKLIIIE
jgi:hypothetical protein